MKAITKVGAQSILRGPWCIFRVPLLFAHFCFKAKVFDSRSGALRAGSLCREAEQSRRSLLGGGQPSMMAAELHSQMWMEPEEAKGFPSFMLKRQECCLGIG